MTLTAVYLKLKLPDPLKGTETGALIQEQACDNKESMKFVTLPAVRFPPEEVKLVPTRSKTARTTK